MRRLRLRSLLATAVLQQRYAPHVLLVCAAVALAACVCSPQRLHVQDKSMLSGVVAATPRTSRFSWPRAQQLAGAYAQLPQGTSNWSTRCRWLQEKLLAAGAQIQSEARSVNTSTRNTELYARPSIMESASRFNFL